MRKGLIYCSVFAAMLLLSGCNGKEKTKTEIVTVQIDTVRGDYSADVLEFPAKVKAAKEVNLAFKVGGTLQSVNFKEGEIIKRGELIAKMDPRDYQLQLQATEAQYNNIKADAERVIALYSDSVSTGTDYDKARYGLEQITAKYENAKDQLGYTNLYAPFDCYLHRIIFDAPTVVAAGMPVLTVVSANRPEIEINIPASTYIRKNEISSFTASFDIIQESEIPLKLISINNSANSNQLYGVRLALPNGLRKNPSVGMNGVVNIEFKKELGGKVAIPASALFKNGDNSCVWIYNAGKVELRRVDVEALDTDGNAVITNGLKNGELIVTAGVHKIKEGQSVKPMKRVSKTNVGGLL